MKFWEVCKEENEGKVFKCGINKYVVELNGFSTLTPIFVLKIEGSDKIPSFSQYDILNMEFEEIEKPITFNELLQIEKILFKVNHELLDKYNINTYVRLDNLLMFLCDHFTEFEIKRILREGEFYSK